VGCDIIIIQLDQQYCYGNSTVVDDTYFIVALPGKAMITINICVCMLKIFFSCWQVHSWQIC